MAKEEKEVTPVLAQPQTVAPVASVKVEEANSEPKTVWIIHRPNPDLEGGLIDVPTGAAIELEEHYANLLVEKGLAKITTAPKGGK